MVRVRFAPSPTGNLHIGGARTALFNWLYARAQNGVFVLRIEDTDMARSKPEYLEEILFSLQWLGLKWDELYHQSQRVDVYRTYAEALVKQGKAYYSKKVVSGTDEGAQGITAASVAQPSGEAIIFKVSPQKITVRDLIRGPIEFDAETIKDQVLMKSDGSPTYNFACVVDDALMHISHVIRGDDHISNTPKQILLYEALGFPVPAFAHLPLILSKQGGRLSKRKGATAISEYRQMGYIPQALVNYLMLLGWSPGGDREMVGVEEAIRLFDVAKINKTAAVLDLDKLDWMNNEYLKQADPVALVKEVIPLLQQHGLGGAEGFDPDYTAGILKLFLPRLTTLQDFPERADYFFLAKPRMDEEAVRKFLGRDFSKEFGMFIERVEALPVFDIPSVEAAFRALIEDLHIEAKVLIHPVRVALTGKTVGPGLFEVIYYLGKSRFKERLLEWVKK